jgi:dihydrofolate reductase
MLKFCQRGRRMYERFRSRLPSDEQKYVYSEHLFDRIASHNLESGKDIWVIGGSAHAVSDGLPG